MPAVRRCKDCVPGSRRKAPHAGPRCATHHRERRRKASAARKANHVEITYGITEAEYQAILAYQGGVCYICHRKPWARKRLAVDHDHGCCPGKVSCGNCVRGLLCGTCNLRVIGHLRDDPAALERGAEYLRNPPARMVLTRKVTT